MNIKGITSALLAAGLLATSQMASAITYILDNSNTEGSWPDGTAYAFVTLTQNGFNVDVTVDANDAAFQPPTLPNYGIQAFAFNDLSNSLVTSDIDLSGLPTDWVAGVPPAGSSDGFGMFDVELSTTGSSRQDPLMFTVKNTTVANFSDQSSKGIWFAVHITDIEGDGVTSAWFAGGDGNEPPSSVVPVPAAVWLFGSGLIGMIGVARRKAA